MKSLKNILFAMLVLLPLFSWAADAPGGQYFGTTADGASCRIFINRTEPMTKVVSPLLIREEVMGTATANTPGYHKGDPIIYPYATGTFPDSDRILAAISSQSTEVLQATFDIPDQEGNPFTVNASLSFEFNTPTKDISAIHLITNQAVLQGRIDCIMLMRQ